MRNKLFFSSVLLAASVSLSAQKSATITLHADQGTQVIPKEIYGQFAEHLGTCIYGGLWVGENSDIRIEYMQAGGEGTLQFDLGYIKPFNPHEIATMVSEAEAIVFVGGISPKVEGEELPVSLPGFKGGDRTRIELPQVQRDLLHELHKTGKPIILVLCSGSAIGLSAEVDLTDAIVQAWYPGQAGGMAEADELIGDFKPAGRLPVTY